MAPKRSSRRRRVPWAGWAKEAPDTEERDRQLKKCGRKCFLSTKGTGFPVCKKGSCSVSTKGLYAAYVRARQFRHSGVAKRAVRELNKRGIEVGEQRRSTRRRRSTKRTSRRRASKRRTSKRRTSKRRTSKRRTSKRRTYRKRSKRCA